MKDIKLFYGLLLLSILFISTKSVKIYYIADGLSNSTATIIFQDELKEMEDDFVYLGFDFVYHSEIAPDSKNYATFNILGNIDSIKYAFTEKESYIINNVDDIKEWKDTDGRSIIRPDEKMKTLLFKVFLKDKNEDIFAENTPSSSPGGYEESKDQNDLTTQNAHTDKIEQSDKPIPTAPIKTDKIEPSDIPTPPPPLKTDKIDENDSTDSDSNSEKSLIEKIKDIIKTIIDFIKKLFGLI